MTAIIFVLVVYYSCKYFDEHYESKQHKIDRINAEKAALRYEPQEYDFDGYKNNVREYCISQGIPPIGIDWRDEYVKEYCRLNNKRRGY